MENEDNNGLAIGAHEAAFCVDAGATFVYEMCKNIIDRLKYAGGEFFQFTAELWKPPGNKRVPTKEETKEEREILNEE
eukprot:13168090-Ditylum_brightwellii.AAC.1